MAGEIHPYLSQLFPVQLDQLDVDEDFRFRLVVYLDDLFRNGDLVLDVLDRDGVELIVDGDVPDLENLSQKGLNVLDVGVGEEERLDHLILELSALVLSILINQDRVVIDDLVGELRLEHDHLEGLLEAHVVELHVYLLVRLDSLVEHEVDTGDGRHDVEDLSQLDLDEIEPDLNVRLRIELGSGQELLPGLLLGYLDFTFLH